MFQLHSTPPPRRSGVILLIVVVMLGLFLVVGVSFMLYAESEASASRIYREAFTVNFDRADLPPDQLLQWALGQLVYDVDDVGDGVYSAMRGHSLARNMYGWNYTPKTPYPNYTIDPKQNYNINPFNGYGKIDDPNLDPRLFPAYSNRALLNHTFFPNYSNPTSSFIRDPERVGVRQTSGSPLNMPSLPPTSPFSGGWNAPYTYPDHNSVFLAALKANDPGGSPRVMMPSFSRIQGTPFDTTLANIQSPDPTVNPWLNTSDPALKYLVLRPRPAENYYNTTNAKDPHNFPLPASLTGDVQNLVGGTGNDSFWMDLGFPVQATRGGTKFKPLFAFLVVDLDGRVNLNVHGNNFTSGGKPANLSNEGVGKDEVNIRKVLTDTTNPNEVQYLFAGNNGLIGRYGTNGIPGGAGTLASPTPEQYPLYQNINPPGAPQFEPLAPYLMRVDYDAVDDNGQPTRRFQMPSSYQTLPNFNQPSSTQSGYDSLEYQTSTANAPTHSPLLYNVLTAGRLNSIGVLVNDDKPLTIGENLYYLLGAASGPNHQRAYLYQLGLANNLNQPKIRHMTTVLSNDLDVPGSRPWVTSSTTSPLTLPDPPPNGQVAQFQPTSTTGFQLTRIPAKNGVFAANVPTWQPGYSEFIQGDGRAWVMPRLDLNRKLTPYPKQLNLFDPALIGPPPGVGGMPNPPVPVTANPLRQYYRAVWERQKFAEDIYARLVHATGADITATPSTNPAAFNARRYLAQLAVNIVDYLDDDEFSTPFPWFTNPATGIPEYVYGVESPKVSLNEVYSEIKNTPGDTDTLNGATQPFLVHFWLELFNTHMDANLPTPTQNNDPVTTVNRGYTKLETGIGPGGATKNPAYRIRVYQESAPPDILRKLDNRSGDPEEAGTTLTKKSEVTQWTTNPKSGWSNTLGADPSLIRGNDGTSACPDQDNRGLYVLGSNEDIESESPVTTATNRVGQNAIEGLVYSVPVAQNVPQNLKHTIVLQRLLCPHQPYNPSRGEQNNNPNLPDNPYITVDYASGVIAQDAVHAVQVAIPGTGQPNPNYKPIGERRSVGRSQPLAAATQQTLNPTNPPHPHTFFHPNVPGTQFDWLVHLDRRPISIGELLHVSGFKPQEITQTFVDSTKKFQHVAPWKFDQSIDNAANNTVAEKARLFRALEYFTVGDRSNWSSEVPASVPVTNILPPSSGGRRPGMINVNTIWDTEILSALTDPPVTASDPNAVNFFGQAEVGQAWAAINQRRRQALVARGDTPGPEDHPFLGFANPGPDDPNNPPPTGTFPTKPGIGGTVLAGDFNNSAEPNRRYLYDEMLTKIANHVTTRSNTFAVYLTVGFFEVVDDTVRPVKMGAEIRTRNGLPIRHKMFAVVDRTQLATEDPRAIGAAASAGTTQGGNDANNNQKVQFFVTSEDGVAPEEVGTGKSLSIVGGITNPMVYDGQTINFARNPPVTGATLPFTMYADTGTQQETLLGCSISPTTGQLVVPQFRKAHAPGFTLSYLLPGNPGPQGSVNYSDPRYSQVFPMKPIIIQ